MFDQLRMFVKKGAIEKERNKFLSPDPEFMQGTTYYNFDPETDIIYWEFWKELEDAEPEKRSLRESLQQNILKRLRQEWKLKDFRIIKEQVNAQPTVPESDKRLDYYVAQINQIVETLYENVKPGKAEFLRKHFQLIAKDLQSLASPYHTVGFIDYIEKVEKRGNPNMKENRKVDVEQLKKIVERANELIENEPEYYLPSREGAFISNSLKGILADEFNLAESTIYNNLKEKCRKKGRLFTIKIGY